MTLPRKTHNSGSAAGVPLAGDRAPPSDGGEPGQFSIVGMGASAGGLEALELFLRHVPDCCGLAFVVVVHLDPTHEVVLVDLLSRFTAMTVVQAADGLLVEPNHVYVIPPNKDLSIRGGVLHLQEPEAPRGRRLPIDFFLRSLAVDQPLRSVGVLFSGMGSDGTLGLGAIKEHGGSTFVQTPASAKFQAMPQSAIDAGVADVVAPAEELPGRIIADGALAAEVAGSYVDALRQSETQRALEMIFALLRTRTAHDISQYKRNTIHRRIARRMGVHQIHRITDYAEYLQENPQETELLFKELLIGVTAFFRDPLAWEGLSKAIRALLDVRSPGGLVRAWVAGCSTGEEAYSLAILLHESLARLPPTAGTSLLVFATDLDQDSIDRARRAVYPATIVDDVSEERLRRYFVRQEHGYKIHPEIREKVIFSTQNIIMDPPFTKIDVLSCRNLLIYMQPGLQHKLSSVFHHSLERGGLLFLGTAETISPTGEFFVAVDGKARIYRRLEIAGQPTHAEIGGSPRGRPPIAVTHAAIAPAAKLQVLVDRQLIAHYSPAAVVTNAHGDILYVNGRTGEYLEPAAGKANWNIHAMARADLGRDLVGAFQCALTDGRAVIRSSVKSGPHGSARAVDVTIEALRDTELQRDTMLIVFVDAPTSPVVAAPGTSAPGVATPEHAQELLQARENLQAACAGMQRFRENLTSANEELQSANEELQSMNEELMTSKEETQSLNEELQTLNDELRAKLDELSQTNDDMRNLLDSTDIATLFLDDRLRVRRFTPRVTKIIKLIPTDVDRPITDLATDLVYPNLAADSFAVLQSLVLSETPVETIDGRWFSVRIMPYRTSVNRVDGLVITFVDITAAKALESELRRAQGAAQP